MVTTEETLVEGLARLYKNNMWELHRLLKSIISDKGPQFVTDFIKKLNSMLKIEIRLLMAFYL